MPFWLWVFVCFERLRKKKSLVDCVTAPGCWASNRKLSQCRVLWAYLYHAWCVIEMRLGKYVCSGSGGGGGGSFGKRVSTTAPHILAKQAAPQPAPSIVNVRRRGRRRRKRRRRLRCWGSAIGQTQPTPAAWSGCFAHLLIAFRFKLIKNHLSVIV